MRLNLEVELTLKFESERIAEALHKATAPDNVSAPPNVHIVQLCEGAILVFAVKAGDILKVKSTVDDFLRCLIPAYKAIVSSGSV